MIVLAGPTVVLLVVYKWFSLALAYSVCIYRHEPSSKFHHSV